MELAAHVRERAGNACEYCGLPASNYPMPFQTDHVIALQHGGNSEIENLAWCCPMCNRYKGPNTAGLDSTTGALTRLFHPRTDRWSAHFRYKGPRIEPLTACGRVTVQVLNLNHPLQIALRNDLMVEGLWPARP